MQIVENWSRISGTVESFDVPELPGADGTLTIRVNSVRDVPRKEGAHYANLLNDAKGTVVRIRVPAEAIRHLNAHPGGKIELDVRRGRSPATLFAHPEGTVRVSSDSLESNQGLLWVHRACARS